jgi:glyoxalase family protein
VESIVKGLHHITLVTGNYVVNNRFYTEVLGLRRVKLSVNQDDIYHRHLFYANFDKPTGSAITFFEWPELPRGYPGYGSPHHLAYRVGSPEALAKWLHFLRERNIAARGPYLYGDLASIYLRDPDGVLLELTTPCPDADIGYLKELFTQTSTPTAITQDMRLTAFDHASPIISDPKLTSRFLEKFLDIVKVDNAAGVLRVLNMDGDVYLRCIVDPVNVDGYVARGSVHHIALCVESEEIQRLVMRRLNSVGWRNSGIVDRFWFKSLYFRDPDGNLFELATEGPGYDVDEPRETLGSRLVLPPWLEPLRQQIEKKLAERDAGNTVEWPTVFEMPPEPPEPLAQ